MSREAQNPDTQIGEDEGMRRRTGVSKHVLTLGGLFHHLRNGLGDNGRFGATIAFDQGVSPATSGAMDAVLHPTHSFRADLRFDEGRLRRGHLESTSMAGRPQSSVYVLGAEGGWFYSTDGVSFGILETAPDLFDIDSFEGRLAGIPATDVTIEEAVGEHGRVVHTLNVTMENDAFWSVLALFGSEDDGSGGAPNLSGYSLSLTAVDDLTVDYWWMTAESEFGASADGSHVADGAHVTDESRIVCHVSVRLQPSREDAEPTGRPAELTRPRCAHLDEVWALTRSSQG